MHANATFLDVVMHQLDSFALIENFVINEF
jgi:hypothetical protein